MPADTDADPLLTPGLREAGGRVLQPAHGEGNPSDGGASPPAQLHVSGREDRDGGRAHEQARAIQGIARQAVGIVKVVGGVEADITGGPIK